MCVCVCVYLFLCLWVSVISCKMYYRVSDEMHLDWIHNVCGLLFNYLVIFSFFFFLIHRCQIHFILYLLCSQYQLKSLPMGSQLIYRKSMEILFLFTLLNHFCFSMSLNRLLLDVNLNLSMLSLFLMILLFGNESNGQGHLPGLLFWSSGSLFCSWVYDVIDCDWKYQIQRRCRCHFGI